MLSEASERTKKRHAVQRAQTPTMMSESHSSFSSLNINSLKSPYKESTRLKKTITVGMNHHHSKGMSESMSQSFSSLNVNMKSPYRENNWNKTLTSTGSNFSNGPPVLPSTHNHHTNGSSSNRTPRLLILLLVVFGAVLLGVICLFFTMRSSLAQVNDVKSVELTSIVRDLEYKLKDVESDRAKLTKKVADLQREADRLTEQNKKLNDNKGLRGRNQDVENIRAELDHYMDDRKSLHERIQIFSRHRVIENWGPGPHRVEVELAFDPAEVQDSHMPRGGKFVMEMAPIDYMPHSVYHFLLSVSLGLYNGTSFFRNAGHIIQGGAAPNHLSAPNTPLLKRFVDNGLEHLLFQEYNFEFPHSRYTLGMAGRPGGPDFYINVIDNIELHGPGGQGRTYSDNEADPCIARIIENTDLIDRMHQAPVGDEGFKYMVHAVAIVGMKIL